MARTSSTFEVITFDGESFEVQHQYTSTSACNRSHGAWANFHMHKDHWPTFITFNGEWYFGNEEARKLLEAGRIPLMFIPNSEAMWRRFQSE